MYISYKEYTALYDYFDEKLFNRLAYDACRHIDRLTTGVDGVKKLKVAFPSNEDDATAVKRCAAHIVNFLHQIHEAETSASVGRGYEQTPMGMRGKVVSSVSAGTESVSYSAGSQKTDVDVAAESPAERERMIRDTVREYLSGVADKNGVNLLYMGRYPGR